MNEYLVDTEQFKKNVDRWSLFYPIEASQLFHLKSKNISFELNENHNLNLKTQFKNEKFYFHSLENPLEEARLQFNQLNLKDIEVIYFFGVGLGYFYEVAKEWLHRQPNHTLVFLENDLEVIYHLFQTKFASEILFDRQTWLVHFEVQGKELESLVGNFLLKKTIFVSLGLYDQLKRNEAEVLKSKLDYFLHLKTSMAAEFSTFGKRFYDNFYHNILTLSQAKLGASLCHKFDQVPAIICGAGPSLAKQLPLLKQLNNKALIFAGGTAMNALNTGGVLPHFGVGIDPNPAQFTRLVMNQGYETPYFYRNRMNYKALQVVHGPHLYVPGSTGYKIAKYYEDKLEIKESLLSEGFNVINFSLSIAHAMGCNPIIFVGVDLAYTDMLSYCPGILNHPLHNRRENFGTKSSQEELINKPDYQGEPTLTLWKWISESAWFANFARNNPKTTFYNATEGGLGFTGIKNITLKTCIEQILNSQRDLSALVHGEIVQANFTQEFDDASIVQMTKEMLSSLKRSHEICLKVASNISSSSSLIESLEQEDAFKWILQDTSQCYEDIFKSDLTRLNVDRDFYSDPEFSLKKNEFEANRYYFLAEAASSNIKLIEAALKEHIETFPIILRPSQEIEQPQMLEENEEVFAPLKGTFKRQEFYPDQKLKMEQYFIHDQLHGPSIFYSRKGMVLSRHWFINGLQQGKAYKYNETGHLSSIQQFKDGHWEGRQEFYYPQGSLKTVLNYSNGFLNGEVKLFYSNGQLKRKLNFVNGKRQGYDAIFNQWGQMVILAEFDKDQATGMARQWYDDGKIAKEIIFFPDSQDFIEREWKEDGKMLEQHKGLRGDYFDNVSLQTEKLTKTLETMSNQVQAIVPVIENLSSKKIPVDLLDSLKEEIQHLDEINKKLLFETGIDRSNSEESIWKTPSLKIEVEEQIEKLSSMMTTEMGHLQKSLMDTLEKISQKLEQQKDKNDDQ